MSRGLYDTFLEKVKQRSYELGICFEQNITFVDFSEGKLTWESSVEDSDKKLLITHWGVINMFVKEVFGFETKIVNIPKRKVSVYDEKLYHKSSIDIYNEFKNKPIIFISGKAGTGKTTLLKSLAKKVKNSVVLAPTGMAALHAGGMTIHKFFHLDFSPYVPNDSRLDKKNIDRHFKYTKDKIDTINRMELLIIDEISMVKPYIIDVLDKILRRYRKNNLPFGGIKVIMFGDLFQLPPVVTDEDGEKKILYEFYETEFFFSSKSLLRYGFYYKELLKIHRQTDTNFIEILNRIRLGNILKSDIELLNKRFSSYDPEGYLELTTTNNKANYKNEQKLAKINKKEYIFEAVVEGDFKENIYPTNKILSVKVGSQIMILLNKEEIRNGMIGIIEDIKKDEIKVNINNKIYIIEKHEWENKVYKYSKEEKKVITEIIGTFRQFPIKLAWAITIHKSQGQTFDNILLDLDGVFAEGQAYVALSRCRSLEGIKLKNYIDKNMIRASSKVTDFYNNLNNPTNIYTEKYTHNDNLSSNVLLNYDSNVEISDSIHRWQDDFFLDLDDTRNVRVSIERYSEYFPNDIPMDISPSILFGLYSISKKKVYGSRLANLVAMSNNYFQYYKEHIDIFIRVLDKYECREYLFNMDYKGTFKNKLDNYLSEKTPQNHKYDELIKILFFHNDVSISKNKIENPEKIKTPIEEKVSFPDTEIATKSLHPRSIEVEQLKAEVLLEEKACDYVDRLFDNFNNTNYEAEKYFNISTPDEIEQLSHTLLIKNEKQTLNDYINHETQMYEKLKQGEFAKDKERKEQIKKLMKAKEIENERNRKEKEDEGKRKEKEKKEKEKVEEECKKGMMNGIFNLFPTLSNTTKKPDRASINRSIEDITVYLIELLFLPFLLIFLSLNTLKCKKRKGFFNRMAQLFDKVLASIILLSFIFFVLKIKGVL